LEVVDSTAMKIKRVVANVGVSDPAQAKRFDQDILGLDVLMDMGWIATYGSLERMPVQLSFMTEGGSGTPVPDLSIEVDDLETALARVKTAALDGHLDLTGRGRRRPLAGSYRSPR
jgi:hypothetical protein